MKILAPKAFCVLLAVLAAAFVSAGCGQSSSATSTTIRLTSSGVQADGVVASNYSCGYAPIWLPLKWGAVPSGTDELAVYFGWFDEKGKGAQRKIVVPYATMISKIKPTRHEYTANSPTVSGGFSGYNSTKSCPPDRTGQHMLMELFALPRHQRLPSMTRAFVTGLTEATVEGGRARATPPSVPAFLDETLGRGHFVATYAPVQSRPASVSSLSKPPHVRLPPGPPPKHLVVKELRRGSGAVVPRKGEVKIRTNYVAVSYRTGKPYEVRWSKGGAFNVGFGPGIEVKGWEKGLPGMRVGGRRELLVPSKLAYGEGAVLFVIDLLGVER